MRQSGLRADAKMRHPTKQEMVRMMLAMKQASAVDIFNHPIYEFQFDSVLHYLTIVPRDQCNNYKVMFEDLKFYEALKGLDGNCEIWIMVHIKMPKQDDDVACEMKHAVYVNTSDNIPKVVERSLHMLCYNNYYIIDKF